MLKIKQTLKKNQALRVIVKKIKIFREFHADARFMNKHLLDGGRQAEHEQYYILLRVHSLEKGMSYRNSRAFGSTKALDLVSRLTSASPITVSSFAYTTGISILRSWLTFHEGRDDRDEYAVDLVRQFLEKKQIANNKLNDAGVREYSVQSKEVLPDYRKVIRELSLTRHSVRTYSEANIDSSDLEEILVLTNKCPSACNRQMARLHIIDEPEAKRFLYDTLHGTGGIDFDSCRLGVISYDSASLEFYGERNQGYLNAGIFAMSLVQTLHAYGIGSCLLQFGNTNLEESRLRRVLGLPAAERIAVGISFGYPAEEYNYPSSVRKPVSDYFLVDGINDDGYKFSEGKSH